MTDTVTISRFSPTHPLDGKKFRSTMPVCMAASWLHGQQASSGRPGSSLGPSPYISYSPTLTLRVLIYEISKNEQMKAYKCNVPQKRKHRRSWSEIRACSTGRERGIMWRSSAKHVPVGVGVGVYQQREPTQVSQKSPALP